MYFGGEQAGDGTTSVVVLANEFMKEAKPFVEEGVHPQVIIKSYRQASHLVRPFSSSFPLFLDSCAKDDG